MWKRKVKEHDKGKANASAPTANKRRRIEEPSMERKESSCGRRVRIVSDSDEGESSRNVVYVSVSDSEGNPESGLCLIQSVLELDSIETVWSQVMLHELQKDKSFE